LLKIVSVAVKEMSEGELLQIQKSRNLNITEDVYFEIIRKKTAALYSICTQVVLNQLAPQMWKLKRCVIWRIYWNAFQKKMIYWIIKAMD
jgi:octaprenyl-diphosphate synthase